MSARNEHAVSPRRVSLRSPGKINLFLHVIGRRADGYHDIQTIFQFIDLCDTVEVMRTGGNRITRIDLHDHALPETDLTIRAALRLAEHAGLHGIPGTRITLTKRIPPGSGMGGGSSNAAATLIALNRLWGTNLDTRSLMRIGAGLGADVPVFIHGRACWAEGVGDRLTDCDPPENWYCLWIPSCHVSTQIVFSHPDLVRNHPKTDYQDFLRGCCRNHLEAVSRNLYAPVDAALKILSRHGAAQMNGSGSSVFLPCSSRQHAQTVLEQLPREQDVVITHSRNRIRHHMTESSDRG